MKKFVFFIVFGLFLAINTSAQSVDKNKLPEYVVVTVKAKSLLSDFDVDIRIKKKQYAPELKKLEKRLDNNDLVESYNDLLIEMNELGFEFIESFVRNESGSRHNLIFRKKS